MRIFLTVLFAGLIAGASLFAESPQSGKVAVKYFSPKISIGTATAHADAVTSTTLAQAPAAAPQAPEVKQESFLDKILDLIKNSGAGVAGFLVLFEVLVRIFPSKSPLSILVPVKYFVDGFVTIFSWISNSLLVPMINIANRSDTKLKPEV